MSLAVLSGVPSSIGALLQQNTLQRIFHDALFARQLYRLEAIPERWESNLGERMVFTRAGLIAPVAAPLVPGQDPQVASYATEQWKAEAQQWSGSLDTNMATSNLAIASLFLRNTQQLGLQAAQTLNRLARNKLFTAYLQGEAMVIAAAAAAAPAIRVSSLSGFTERLQNGELLPVSAGNALPITFTTVGEPANAVTGAVPDNPAVPFGSGTLLLQNALTVGVAPRDGVFAETRTRRIRVSGTATVDGITNANIVTLNTFIDAVSYLREQNVPPHSDGYYHVHLPPACEAQLFRDNHWQRLHQSLPESYAYRELAVGQALGCIFFRNTEDPSLQNVSATQADAGGAGGALLAPEIGAEVVNANGVPIRRTIVTGGAVLVEKYLDESKYISEAGVTGKIGEFDVINGGAAVMTDRIRFVLRAPLDRLQQIVSQSWSWSGDFPVPSDRITGDPSAYKRAIAIESA